MISNNGEEINRLYKKTDETLLADVFQKLIKVSSKEYGTIQLYCVSICSYTLQCGLEYNDTKLQILQDKDMILLIENSIRERISSGMGDRFVFSDENQEILYIDATKLYGHSMSQPLPYDENEIHRNVLLKQT